MLLKREENLKTQQRFRLRDLLRYNLKTVRAYLFDAPHDVQKEDEKPPQGNELKAPFGQLVVTGRRQMAARADGGRTLTRSHSHFDTLLVGTEVGVLVDKTSETMAAV